MNYDYENLIIEDMFSESEIEDIYNHIESTPDDKKKFVEVFSHTAYLSWMPDHIVNKIVEKAQSTTDIPIVLRELSFARYETVKDGVEVKLTPHRDETFREPRLTVDIQLRSNIDWPISVEGRDYQLKDNQALTFAGTHQVHWRPKIEFKDDNFLDMIFCHFSAKDFVSNELGHYDPLSVPDLSNRSEHDRIMQDKADYWQKVYDES